MSMLFGILLRGGALVETLVTSGLSSADPVLSSDIVGNGNRPISGLRLKTTGKVATASGDTGSSLSYSDGGDWLENPVDASAYECRATNVVETGAAGTFIGPTSFVTLSSDVSWTWTKDADTMGTASVEFDVEIREIADTSNNVAYIDFNMDAEEFV